MQSTLGPLEAPQRFALLRKLGAGGMGVVYEALDHKTQRTVALKTLHEHKPRYLLELKREFRAVQGLFHPNLVQLGDLFQSRDAWFFTMELVQGRTFTDWVRGSWFEGSDLASTQRQVGDRGQRLARLRAALPQLADALVAVHDAGLVHRDLKPSNVLVTESGRVVLLDFGLVRRADLLASSLLAGTPAYMAPEQAGGHAITTAADCYALGVVLYQALTDQLPFIGTSSDLLAQKQSWQPIAPHLITPDVPRDLEQLCLALLAPEPDKRPSARDIAVRLAQARPPRRVTATVRPRFIGRTRELSQIEESFARTRRGERAVVVCEGESGIGKSALLDAAASRLEQLDESVRVLRSRCFQREVAAFAGVDMLVDALVEHLRRLAPDEVAFFTPRHLSCLRQVFPALAALPFTADAAGPRTEREARTRALAAFKDLFARFALRNRIVIVIDDAQWLTEESFALLDALMSPDDPVPLLLMLGARDHARGSLATWLANLEVPAHRVELAPLSTDESVELLRGHLELAPSTLRRLAHDCAGHPLFLRELACAGTHGGAGGIDELMRERASRLDASCTALLQLVCAAARPVASEIARSAAALDLAEAERAIHELVARRFIAAERGTLQPAHDRVRTAIHLAPTHRRALQCRLGAAVEEHDPSDVESLAAYWHDAGDKARAAGYAARGAERAMAKLAFERARELADIALHGTWSDAERAALLTGKADALVALGRGQQAAEAYLEAAGLAGDSDELVVRAAAELIRAGRVEDGAQVLARVLGRLAITLPTSRGQAVRALLVRRCRLALRGPTPGHRASPKLLRRIDACWTAGDLLALFDPLPAAAIHTLGLLLALDAGEPARLARALAFEAAFISMRGASARARMEQHLAAARVHAAGVAQPWLDAIVTLSTGVCRLQLGELTAAQHAFDAAEAAFEACPGALWEAGSAREFALWTLSYRGELDALARRLGGAVEIAQARSDRLAELKLLCGPSHLALLAADEVDRIGEVCESQRALAERYPFLQLCTLFARCHAAIYRGEGRLAADLIERERAAIKASHLLESQFFRTDFTSLCARSALAAFAETGEPRYREAARTASRALRRERTAWATALATMAEAALEGTAARLGQAAALLDGAGLGAHASAVRWQIRGTADEQWRSVRRPEHLARVLAPVPR
ncbi:MAG: protein kinase [Kofleriaceae bacterium]|nr:protein kinase [Kofleriaceae bacterium]